MTVYVWTCFEKPRVRHLPYHDSSTDTALQSKCGAWTFTAERHDNHRRNVTAPAWRERLKPIDYDNLPLCKRCEKASRK